jgi:hypothetical protein
LLGQRKTTARRPNSVDQQVFKSQPRKGSPEL